MAVKKLVDAGSEISVIAGARNERLFEARKVRSSIGDQRPP